MTPESVQDLLERIASGDLPVAEGLAQLASLPFSSLPHSTLDTHRELRQGMPEVVYGAGKSADQLVEILQQLHQAHRRALATRVNRRKARLVQEALPEANYHAVSRLLTMGAPPQPPATPYVVVACAGTSDLPVAEEASQTLEFLGHRVERLIDVGVAGVHRLFAQLDVLRGAQVVISVAGMEGALTSLIGGLVAAPVIGVPTSVGYGVARGGETALHAMLSSCAAGVAVVNIDNGFGAAAFAHSILKNLPPTPQ